MCGDVYGQCDPLEPLSIRSDHLKLKHAVCHSSDIQLHKNIMMTLI